MNWTEDQINAIERIIEWQKDPDDLFMTLEGAAGTGKSTLLKECLQKYYKRFLIAVSAPTHKARLIVESFTGYDSLTIQALLGLKPDLEVVDFDINNPIFKPKKEPEMQYRRYVPIDESSMINNDLLDKIIETATTYKVKTLFIGDKCQLPPVVSKDTTFTIDNHKLYSEVFNIPNIVRLKELVRQSPTNPLTAFLVALRSDIHTNETKKIDEELVALLFKLLLRFKITDQKDYSTKDMRDNISKASAFKYLISLMSKGRNLTHIMGKDGEGISIYRNATLFKEHVQKKFEGVANKRRIDQLNKEVGVNLFNGIQAFNELKYLAFTNSNVSKWNKIIRDVVFPNEKELIVPGDVLLSYKPLRSGNVEILTNSMDYTVTAVDKTALADIPTYKVDLISNYDSNPVNCLHIVNHIDDRQFLSKHEDAHKNARETGFWRKYYSDFKNYLLCLRSFNKYYKYRNLPDGLRHIHYTNLPYKDLDYGYAITIHKSQGSTYDSVFVNGKDIAETLSYPGDTTVKYDLFYKLLYVSLSRASSHVYLYF